MKKGPEKVLDVTDNRFIQELQKFIEDKLADEAQAMKIETIYKNFMGIGGPKDYGLSRRMVQIYLLCLVHIGKIRIGTSAKSGLTSQMIEYSNISSIDFSTKILDSLDEIHKMEKPENWEILRPYAEKILADAIPVTHDDAEISRYRTRLKEEFIKQKELSERLVGKARSLFDALQYTNPYSAEISQVADFYASEISTSNDINLLLFALKNAFGYKAFDEGKVDVAELDDLANRLKNYRDLQIFMGYESELRAVKAYCDLDLPDLPQLDKVRKIQKNITEKLNNLQNYIDSEIKLKTELIGKIPPDPSEKNTYGCLIQEYATVYLVMHDNLLARVEDCQDEIRNLINGNEMKAFKMLEKISALQPEVSQEIEDRLSSISNGLFGCDNPSKASIEEQLRNNPIHECSLSFNNYSSLQKEIDEVRSAASLIFDSTIDGKLKVFLNAEVKKRLEQGKSEKIIASLLKCSSVEEIRSVLVESILEDPSLVDVINRYLKRIVVKGVTLTDFKPSMSIIEKSQVEQIAKEIQDFLKNHFDTMEVEDGALPMLKLE